MLNKIFLIIISSAIILSSNCLAQMYSTYNLNFEQGSEDSPVYGWILGNTAVENDFKAVISETAPLEGLASAKIINTKKKQLEKDNVGSLYQRIKAQYYINKKIRFKAYIKMLDVQPTTTRQYSFEQYINYTARAPYLFINAKDRGGADVASQTGNNITIAGWNEVSIEITIPQNADDITFGVCFADTNDIYIDNCSIEIISNDSLYYAPPSPLTLLELMYLVPFANIAAKVQYFHPSKNASSANWDNVMLQALSQLENIKTLYPLENQTDTNIYVINKTILDSLQAFFTYYCPQIELADSAIERTKFEMQNNKHLLAWIHYGVPTNANLQNSNSKIVDINGPVKHKEAVAVQYADIKTCQNKEITFSAKAKLNRYHSGATASISIRFENEMGEYISFIKKDITDTNQWAECSVQGMVPSNAAKGLVILYFQGYGKCYFDDAKLHYKDAEKQVQITLKNPSFENSLPFDYNNWMTTNETYSENYQINYDKNQPALGKQALVLCTNPVDTPVFPNADSNAVSFLANSTLNQSYTQSIFNTTKDAIENIYCAMPVLVSAKPVFNKQDSQDYLDSSIIDYETYPITNINQSENQPKHQIALNWNDRNSRLIQIIKTYNLLNLFNVMDIHNNNETTQSLQKNTLDSIFVTSLVNAAVCTDKYQFKNIINDLLSTVKDQKARVWIDNDNSKTYSLPFNWEICDSNEFNQQLFISKSIINDPTFMQSGAQIIKINDKNVKDIIQNLPTWKQYQALAELKYAALNQNATLTILSNNQFQDIQLSHNTLPNKLIFHQLAPSQIVNDSIVYIDLTQFNDKDIYDGFDSVAKYKHWILDCRGETSTSALVLSLFSKAPYKTAQTLLPYKTHPDWFYANAKTSIIPPAKNKHVEGKCVILIDWKTSGSGELLAATAKNQSNITLIGQPTQGSSIAYAPSRLDSEFNIALPTVLGFTPQGEPIYNSPIKPDILVKPSKSDLGTDYILQNAINYLTEKK